MDSSAFLPRRARLRGRLPLLLLEPWLAEGTVAARFILLRGCRVLPLLLLAAPPPPSPAPASAPAPSPLLLRVRAARAVLGEEAAGDDCIASVVVFLGAGFVVCT